MKSSRFISLLSLALLYLITVAVPPAFASGDDWRPVDPAELAMKAPAVEKDADAEALFWDVRVDDDAADLVFTHYVRIKAGSFSFRRRNKNLIDATC